eukprot:TRINITY_DN3450_c0_g1_i1.p1 TRINITY_DN3450_c0_g1~~TRINITY_DN3450_c0_g1_i1.p1  ORF type:complete len:280 (-),score=53.24 TRINITY_DN3450_c0_g1_i1:52-891(-)
MTMRGVVSRQERQKVAEIRDLFINPPKGFVQSHRYFVKEGILRKTCRRTLRTRHFYLFNDVLVYGKPLYITGKLILSQILPLETIRLKDRADQDNEKGRSFAVLGPSKSFILTAETHEEKIDWMLQITQASQKQRPSQGEIDQTFEVEAPVWVPNTESLNCFDCQTQFGLVNRRHHCRACGRCFCAQCSPYKVVLQNIGSDAVRICKECFDRLRDRSRVVSQDGEESEPMTPLKQDYSDEETENFSKIINRLEEIFDQKTNQDGVQDGANARSSEPGWI